MLGFDGVPFKDDDYFTLSVLSNLLGGGMSSRLFQEIREKRGLVYSIYSFTASYADGGLFGVYAGTGEKQVEELLPVMCEEIAKVGASIGEDELARVKAQLKAGILMALESTSARFERIGSHMLVYGRVLDVAEVVDAIEAVDAKAIDRMAARLMASRPTFAALGPVGRLEAMGSLAERFA